MSRQRAKGTLAERLWRRVDQSAGPEGCWPWLGYHVSQLARGIWRKTA